MDMPLAMPAMSLITDMKSVYQMGSGLRLEGDNRVIRGQRSRSRKIRVVVLLKIFSKSQESEAFKYERNSFGCQRRIAVGDLEVQMSGRRIARIAHFGNGCSAFDFLMRAHANAPRLQMRKHRINSRRN